MTKLKKVYALEMPKVRFIGRKYGEGDQAECGGYGNKWNEWFSGGLFTPLENMYAENKAGFKDDDAYIGLMRHKPGEPFEYWIGMFFSADTETPEGYEAVDFEPSRVGVAWLRGPESEVYSQEGLALSGLHEAGYDPVPDAQGACWFMELYACPRFTVPDEEGCIVLDICVFS